MSQAAWPRGGGIMGDLVRRHDWSATALGPLEGWPANLRTSVDIVLNSPMAMVLMWGPQHVMVYNDDYIQIAGARQVLKHLLVGHVRSPFADCDTHCFCKDCLDQLCPYTRE